MQDFETFLILKLQWNA